MSPSSLLSSLPPPASDSQTTSSSQPSSSASVFSYVDIPRRLRDGGSVDKINGLRDVVDNMHCLTPLPLSLIERHLFSLNVTDIDDTSFWDLTSIILKSTSNLSHNFLSQLISSISTCVRKVPAAQSILRSLFKTRHLHRTNYINQLIVLLSALLDSSISNPRFDDAESVFRILTDTLSRLRDVKKTHVFAVQILSHLSPYPQLHVNISALLPHLSFNAEAELSVPLNHQLNSNNLAVLISHLLVQNKTPNDINKLMNLYLQKTNEQLTLLLQNPDQPSSEIIQSITSVTSIFSLAVSQNLRFDSLKSKNQSHGPKQPKKQRISHPVEELFHSLTLLLSNAFDKHWRDMPLIPKISPAIVTMLHLPNLTFDTSLPILIEACASLSTSLQNEKFVLDNSLQNIFIAILKSCSSNRRLYLLLRQLAQVSSGRVLFGRLSGIISSTAVKSELARCTSDLPLGSASTCVNALIPKTKTLLPDEKGCLSLLVSVVLESANANAKDMTIIFRCIVEDVIPLLNLSSENDRSDSRSSSMFLFGTLLLVVTRNKIMEKSEVVDFILSGIKKTISEGVSIDMGAEEMLPSTKVDSEQERVLKIFSFYLSLRKMDEPDADRFCLIRLLAIVIRFSLEEKDSLNFNINYSLSNLLKIALKQSEMLLGKHVNEGKTANNSTLSIFLNCGIVDDVLFMMTSLSDVMDGIFENGGNSDESLSSSIVQMLDHCIKRWITNERLWSELFERKFVCEVLGRAVCNRLGSLKQELKKSSNVGCHGTLCETLRSVLNFILKIPKGCLSQEQETDISRKLKSLTKLLCCDKSKQMTLVTLFCLKQKKWNGDPLGWDQGWDSLDSVDCRVEMCMNMLEWGERSSIMVPDMMNLIVEHFEEWNEACMKAIKDTINEYRPNSQVLKIGINVLKIDSILKTSPGMSRIPAWEENKQGLKTFMMYTMDHLGWYCVYAKESKEMSWVQRMSKETENCQQVLEQMKQSHQCGKDLDFNLQLGAFCILTKSWSGHDVEAHVNMNIVRYMLHIGVKRISECGTIHPERAIDIATLCFQCSEAVLRRIESSTNLSTAWEMICLNLVGLSNVLLQVFNWKSKTEDAMNFLARAVSCVLFMLQNQRAAHCAPWSVMNLFVVNVKFASKLSQDRDMAQRCGHFIAEMITSVDWSYEQGEVSKEVVKTVILFCAQCLCDEAPHTSFEVPVLDALASLMRTVPKDTMPTLISSASPALTLILRNISQLAHRIEYDGQ